MPIAIKNATKADLEKLRPQVSDSEAYDQFIAIIEESTQHNEDLAQLKNRIEQLGETVVKIGRQLIKIISLV